MNRKQNLLSRAAHVLALGACCLLTASCGGGRKAQDTTGATKKIVVGFSQIGAEGPWRTANTASIKAEAARRGIDLRFSDAQQKQENQIKALRSFVAQGVDVIAFSPVVETGWEPVLREIKQAGIPVVLSDRTVAVADPTLFATFIGSDFVEEGRRAAEWLARATNGQAVIAELQGTPGSAPAIDRRKGFEQKLAEFPGMKIIKAQSAEFTRAKGKEVMETFLKSSDGKRITAVFSHDDEMALGAAQAMEEAGVKPGRDILIVSIDGEREAFEALIAGKHNCTVECNPLLGPQLFDTVEALVAGRTVPRRIAIEESVYDQTNAAAALGSRQY